MKKCSKCGLEKDEGEFTKNKMGKNGLSSWCKKCRNEYQKKYNKTTNAKDSRKKSKLLLRYKITVEEYNQMLVNQNYVCAICGESETCKDSRINKPRSLAVDHCHQSGKVRGLLCTTCNKSLGGFKDNSVLLQKAINYLSKID